MKIAIAQLNPTIGDLIGNAQQILSAARQAAQQGGDHGDVQRLDQGGHRAGHVAGQVGPFLRRLADQGGGEIADLVQPLPEAARIARIRQPEARHHHRHEDNDQQPAIEAAAECRNLMNLMQILPWAEQGSRA